MTISWGLSSRLTTFFIIQIVDITMKYLLESFTPSQIEASVSSWTAVNYEMLIRIFYSFLNRTISNIINRFYNGCPKDSVVV